MVKKLGIYIHLPFCKSKCAYCDFYSKEKLTQTEEKEQMDLYQKALLAHMKTSSPTGYSVDTIYFGGGTPTYYGAQRIEGLLRGLRTAFRVEREAEITVEGNPDSLTLSAVQTLRRCGVNRFSLGMQSAKEKELSGVGRIHSPQDTRNAVSHLKACEVKNISLDLIYGLPHQTLESWQETVEEAIALEPDHLSCYGLKVEEGTPLYTRVAQGETLPSEEEQADFYLWTVDRLAQAGYAQYEISNFAKNGLYSRHNMGYWLGKPYLSFGASASSDFGGYRYTFTPDASIYCRSVLEGGEDLFLSHQFMTVRERQEEYLFLRLRTQEGIHPAHYEKALGLPFAPLQEVLERLQEEGWVTQCPDTHWQFTAEGYLRSNLLLTHLLEVQENSREMSFSPSRIPPYSPSKDATSKNFPPKTLVEGQLSLWDN